MLQQSYFFSNHMYIFVYTHTNTQAQTYMKYKPCDLCGARRDEARESYGTLTTVSVVNGPVLTVTVKPQ